MRRTEIINALRDFKEQYKEEFGIISLGLFGSSARDQADFSSDIDIVVKLTKQDLFNLIGIKQELEEKLHTRVDIVSYRDNMNAFLKRRIDRDAVYV